MSTSDFADIYEEIASVAGEEITIAIYKLFKGQQILLPQRLYKKEYVYAYIRANYNGKNIREYLHISVVDVCCAIDGCLYIDRVKRPSPKKLVTQACTLADLPQVLRNELDTAVGAIELCEDPVSKEELILAYQNAQKKRILIMLTDAEGKVLHTVFKNKFRRTIYLEIMREGDGATICNCHYADPRGKDLHISPWGLVTVRFAFTLHKLLEVVNQELEGGFTDVVICEQSTVVLGTMPICGSI